MHKLVSCGVCGRKLPQALYRRNGRQCICGARYEQRRWVSGGEVAYRLASYRALSPSDRKRVDRHPIFRSCPDSYQYEFSDGYLTYYRRIERGTTMRTSALVRKSGMGLACGGKVHAPGASRQPLCGAHARRAFLFTVDLVTCKACRKLLARTGQVTSGG